MTIHFSALIICDRCDAELHMDDVSSDSEVEQRLRANESRWADDENGNQVCGDCWDKWDIARFTLKSEPARAKVKTNPARFTPSGTGKAIGSAEKRTRP